MEMVRYTYIYLHVLYLTLPYIYIHTFDSPEICISLISKISIFVGVRVDVFVYRRIQVGIHRCVTHTHTHPLSNERTNDEKFGLVGRA